MKKILLFSLLTISSCVTIYCNAIHQWDIELACAKHGKGCKGNHHK